MWAFVNLCRHDFLKCRNLYFLLFGLSDTVTGAMGEPLLKKHRTTVEPNETEPDPEPALLDLDKGTSNTAQTKGESGPNTEDQQIPRLCGISRSWPIRFKKHTQDELNRVIPPDHGYWREDAQHDPNCFCWICDFLLERQADDLLLYDYSN